jgi:hypothetical protein
LYRIGSITSRCRCRRISLQSQAEEPAPKQEELLLSFEFEFVVERDLVQIGTNEFFPQLVRVAAKRKALAVPSVQPMRNWEGAFTAQCPLSSTCGRRIVISPMIPYDSPPCYHSSMRHLIVFSSHLIAVLTQLLQPGVRSLIAESLVLKHQLLIVNRSRHRSLTLSSRTGGANSTVALAFGRRRLEYICGRLSKRVVEMNQSLLSGRLSLLVYEFAHLQKW